MMTRKCLVVLAVAILASPVCAEEQSVLKTEKDKVNYGIGVSLGKNFKQQGIDVDVDLVVKGLRDELSGTKLLLPEAELSDTMQKFQAELRQKRAQSRKMAAEDARKEGEAFLAENKKKEGVVTQPSGLQYRILKKGAGKKPKPADTVSVHYRGTLINGTEFDSSHRTGEPATLKVNGVIPGWQEALKLMPVGSKWQLFVPPPLAYGERGAGKDIGPNATLIFEVELLAIK
jgi:FKBP-type peptidyl-prolyl cis-trans isomerase FklB